MSTKEPFSIGHLDGAKDGVLYGWAWDPARPSVPVSVDISVDRRPYCTVFANEYRPGLSELGFGDGRHGFSVPLPEPGDGAESMLLSARIKGTRDELPNSPFLLPLGWDPEAAMPSLKIDPHNLPGLLSELPRVRIGGLYVDPNDTCNADCVYCPNPRSHSRMEVHDFRQFLVDKVLEVDSVQFGCGQEPTADPRLGEFFEALADSALGLTQIRLITNGMLLHRHDSRQWVDCGLSMLLVSIDTVDAELNRRLRPGTEIERILANVRSFRATCPQVEVMLAAVVTSETVGGLERLVEVGDSLGAAGFIFREIYDHWPKNRPPRRGDYDSWIARLGMKKGRMQRLARRFALHPLRQHMAFETAECLELDKLERTGHLVQQTTAR